LVCRRGSRCRHRRSSLGAGALSSDDVAILPSGRRPKRWRRCRSRRCGCRPIRARRCGGSASSASARSSTSRAHHLRRASRANC
jgi:hypothetical protein